MLESVKRVILVLSGKGGVGKSTVSTQLALTLKERGYKVGLLDIDLCGPSVPYLLNLENQSVHQGPEGWIPVYLDNEQRLGVMSIGFLLRSRNDAVVWRGPKKTSMIKQFLEDVCWQELDFLVIDTPPGTSDEHITVMENLRQVPQCGAIIVTTPQEVAIEDVRKEITFCRKTGIPILGIIENMSGYECPNCSECTNIFSSGGGKSLADISKIPFMGSVPIDPRVGKLAGQGLAAVKELPGSTTSKIFSELVDQLADTPNGQRNAPDFDVQNPSQILQALQQMHQSGPRVRWSEEAQEDYKEGHDPAEHFSQIPCNPLNCHPMENFLKLAKMLEETVDPSSEEILAQVKEVGAVNLTEKGVLLTQYQLFIRVALPDWPVLKEAVIAACKTSYNSILTCLKSMNQVFQIQHAKAFNNNNVLGQLVDQFKVNSNQARHQLDMDKEFQEGLTRQLNTFTRSVANLSEKLDSKALELSRPHHTKILTPTTPPTADSISSPQVDLPGRIELAPSTIFKSSFLTVNINASGDISIRPNSSEANPLAELGSMKVIPKTMITILNQDLTLLLSRLNTHSTFIREFNLLTDRSDKLQRLRATFGNIPERDDQWFQSRLHLPQ